MKTFTTRLLDLLQRYEDEAVHGTAPDPAVLCADEPELLPALYEALHQLDGFRQRYEPSATPPTGPRRPAAALPAALHVPGFRLERELGRGGMGVVYAAE